MNIIKVYFVKKGCDRFLIGFKKGYFLGGGFRIWGGNMK